MPRPCSLVLPVGAQGSGRGSRAILKWLKNEKDLHDILTLDILPRCFTCSSLREMDHSCRQNGRRSEGIMGKLMNHTTSKREGNAVYLCNIEEENWIYLVKVVCITPYHASMSFSNQSGVGFWWEVYHTFPL